MENGHGNNSAGPVSRALRGTSQESSKASQLGGSAPIAQQTVPFREVLPSIHFASRVGEASVVRQKARIRRPAHPGQHVSVDNGPDRRTINTDQATVETPGHRRPAAHQRPAHPAGPDRQSRDGAGRATPARAGRTAVHRGQPAEEGRGRQGGPALPATGPARRAHRGAAQPVAERGGLLRDQPAHRQRGQGAARRLQEPVPGDRTRAAGHVLGVRPVQRRQGEDRGRPPEETPGGDKLTVDPQLLMADDVRAEPEWDVKAEKAFRDSAIAELAKSPPVFDMYPEYDDEIISRRTALGSYTTKGLISLADLRHQFADQYAAQVTDRQDWKQLRTAFADTVAAYDDATEVHKERSKINKENRGWFGVDIVRNIIEAVGEGDQDYPRSASGTNRRR